MFQSKDIYCYEVAFIARAGCDEIARNDLCYDLTCEENQGAYRGIVVNSPET